MIIPRCFSDEKIKLWLFLPGRHSSITDKAQAAVSKLRGSIFLMIHLSFFASTYCLYFGSYEFLFLLLKVVASGIWVAPGDSEEISVAFSQSLRNCIERLV